MSERARMGERGRCPIIDGAGGQCGQEKGHDGKHNLLIPSAAPWFPKSGPAISWAWKDDPAPSVGDPQREHLIDGEFQSDKYPWCPRGFVPLKLTDAMAQGPLHDYAERRRTVDKAFSDDLQYALRLKGFVPTSAAPREEAERDLPYSVDADRLKELLGGMHKPGCTPDDDGETSCNACLCSYALVRLLKKIAPTSAAPHDGEALRYRVQIAIDQLCGRIGGCLGDHCGCVKGTLDTHPSAEQRRIGGWATLRNALAARASQGGDAALREALRQTLSTILSKWGITHWREEDFGNLLGDLVGAVGAALAARPEGAAQPEEVHDD